MSVIICRWRGDRARRDLQLPNAGGGRIPRYSDSGGSFDFDPLAEVETATLTVAGDPVQVGSPEPSYDAFEQAPGQAIVAAMNVTAVTNYLTGGERYLDGWELTVRKKSGL